MQVNNLCCMFFNYILFFFLMFCLPSRYEAALILRNACLKDLTLGEVLQILNMIITLKRWIKTRSDWHQITITLPETNNDNDTRTCI